MKKLVVLPFLLLFLGCEDGTPVQPELDLAPEMGLAKAEKAKGDRLKMVPIQGYGSWGYGDWGDLDCNSTDGSTRLRHVNEAYHRLSHMGNVVAEVSQCVGNNPFGFPVYWAQEVITAANGDQLFVFNPGSLPPEMVPEGSLWGMYWVITGGTGRFEGATGDGIVHGTLDFSTMTGEFWVDAMISSVGSSKIKGH